MSIVKFRYQGGLAVECVYSGLRGKITSVTQRLNGCIQYGVQPRSTDGDKIPDGWNVDEQSLFPLLASEAKSFTHDFTFDNGERVEGRVNRFVGIITSRYLYANGCEGYRVEGALDKDGKEQVHNFFLQELQFVDRGLNAPDEKPIEQRHTGGPSVRMPSQRAL